MQRGCCMTDLFDMEIGRTCSLIDLPAGLSPVRLSDSGDVLRRTISGYYVIDTTGDMIKTMWVCFWVRLKGSC